MAFLTVLVPLLLLLLVLPFIGQLKEGYRQMRLQRQADLGTAKQVVLAWIGGGISREDDRLPAGLDWPAGQAGTWQTRPWPMHKGQLRPPYLGGGTDAGNQQVGEAAPLFSVANGQFCGGIFPFADSGLTPYVPGGNGIWLFASSRLFTTGNACRNGSVQICPLTAADLENRDLFPAVLLEGEPAATDLSRDILGLLVRDRMPAGFSQLLNTGAATADNAYPGWAKPLAGASPGGRGTLANCIDTSRPVALTRSAAAGSATSSVAYVTLTRRELQLALLPVLQQVAGLGVLLGSVRPTPAGMQLPGDDALVQDWQQLDGRACLTDRFVTAWQAAFGQEPGVKSGCDSPDSALSTLLQAPQDKTGNGAWRLLETQRQAGKLADWVYLCTLSRRNHFDDDGIGLSVRDVCQPLGKWWQQLESVTRYSESARDAGGLVFEAAQGLRLQFKGGLSVFYLRQRASAGANWGPLTLSAKG
ncbi:hypothetical protein LH452_10240 [Laribacter hongkongensis]|uniref:hypothetical protein n=1 Tax=Laribacter hongkongensis TaxID=168471 RepID=UPI001EFC8CAE|nr:hypothetical protein [Laribacter hongkongensis]MCG9059310.1 hypothetical protein [Laribacter hongkongensis]MCG9086183.1 hypothetical protein [Laribacter hongkongensis]